MNVLSKQIYNCSKIQQRICYYSGKCIFCGIWYIFVRILYREIKEKDIYILKFIVTCFLSRTHNGINEP